MQSAFRALADPTRRDVLHLLRQGPMTSGELAAHFPTAWATVSRHLGVLREAGLVLATRDGQQMIYELNTTVLHDVVEHLFALVRPAAQHAGAGARADASPTPLPGRGA